MKKKHKIVYWSEPFLPFIAFLGFILWPLGLFIAMCFAPDDNKVPFVDENGNEYFPKDDEDLH